MKKAIILISILTIITVSSWAEAKGTCLEGPQFKKMQSLFNIHWDAEGDRCDPNSMSYKVYEALILIDSTDFTGPKAPFPWNQNILPENRLQYVAKRIKDFRWDESCAQLAYVHGESSDKSVYLCPEMFNVSAAAFAETILHEARHKDGFDHVTCKRGSMKGVEGACDTHIELKGSYAVTVEALTSMAISAKNLHPATKKEALSTALLYGDRFNKEFETVEEYLILTDFDGERFKFDGKTLTPLNFGDLPMGHIIPRGPQEFVLFPEDYNLAPVRFSLKDNAVTTLPPLGQMVTKYAEQSPEERRQVRDWLYQYNGDPVNASIEGQKVFVQAYGFSHESTWSEGTPYRLFTWRDVNASVSNRFYVATEEGSFYRYEVFDNGATRITEIKNPLPEIEGVANIGSAKYALSREAKILVKQGDGFVESKEFENLRFKYISRSSKNHISLENF